MVNLGLETTKVLEQECGLQVNIPVLFQLGYLALCCQSYFVNFFVGGCQPEVIHLVTAI